MAEVIREFPEVLIRENKISSSYIHYNKTIGKDYQKQELYTLKPTQLAFRVSLEFINIEQKYILHSFFKEVQGRQESFVFNPKLCYGVLTEPVTTNSSVIKTNDFGYNSFYHNINTKLAIKLKDEDFIWIQDIQQRDGGGLSLVLENPPTKDHNVEEPFDILFNVRFNSDSLTFKLVNKDYTTADLELITTKK